MEAIGIRLFPDGAYIVEDSDEQEIFFRQKHPPKSMLIRFNRSDGQYMLGQDVWLCEGDLQLGTLPTDQAGAVLRDVMTRLGACGVKVITAA